MLLPFQGATAPTRDTQGVAPLALGYVLHWAFSPPLLNPKLELHYAFAAASAQRSPSIAALTMPPA